MKKTLLALTVSALAFSAVAAEPAKASSEKLTINVELLNPEKGNQPIGQVTVTESAYGLVFTPELTGLTAGLHGFHIHENPSCEAKEKDGKIVAGLGAGGHWQSKKADEGHGFPWSDKAHLGDLPALYVDTEGKALNPVLAPRLKTLAEIKGRSIMIHAGGDNHSDNPAPLGGGGARMACGVIN